MTRNLDSVIVDLPDTSMTISNGCHIGDLDHQNEIYCPQNVTLLRYVKLNGFHDNLYNNSKEWNVPTEILISQQQHIQEYQTNS